MSARYRLSFNVTADNERRSQAFLAARNTVDGLTIIERETHERLGLGTTVSLVRITYLAANYNEAQATARAALLAAQHVAPCDAEILKEI